MAWCLIMHKDNFTYLLERNIVIITLHDKFKYMHGMWMEQRYKVKGLNSAISQHSKIIKKQNLHHTATILGTFLHSSLAGTAQMIYEISLLVTFIKHTEYVILLASKQCQSRTIPQLSV